MYHIIVMELNAALNELGMLSAVTESRKDFLDEKQKQHKDCFQVVQLNSQYVTCMGPVLRSRRPKRNGQINDSDTEGASVSGRPGKHSSSDIEEAPVSLRATKPEPDMHVGESRVARHRRTRAKYAKPYQIPGRARACRQRRITDPTDDMQQNSADKAVFELAAAATFHIPVLSRSKSLDELETKGQSTCHSSHDDEIESKDNVEVVAEHMKDLKVK
ncbi:uncharacterized protein [Amphiura filiformis]|uniref:uncharacterized protein n=1 Tax=Amphiura filiformis TaxID=82378 RepID=UPI003B21189C